MSSARDAAARALYNCLDDYGADGAMHGPADAVLAALGIPADATADDVRAAMALWSVVTRLAEDPYRSFEIEFSREGDGRGQWLVDTFGLPLGDTLGLPIGEGDSPAAAVLALAAKLAAQEATDA